ncbi:prephenate dehydrogenase [Kitasatospora purpeofusca]|uniref:prephenate dehydrogenase n=1 Tax=Kitasatospora purpeofusca TaxID=67352 RepID=UPI00224E8C32|nr:prephenate dehydrogenase [Kitasatospora purpeofusca]MCX4757242.1 prephenate dehydrogenase [Kitasatospora purpeofusca]WSR35004.1 prephenate dehydrogenase [Kitasatospora purpeofusca]WSR43222.1 prephenate dehydrogenase [Kitasatospora purpeofusca]
MRTAVVVGTGLIGTSAALALTGRGLTVHLEDADPDAARTAASLGAGTIEPADGPVDLAIIAVPPALVGKVLADCQRRGLAQYYTDVASVKDGPRAEIAALGCDTVHYLGSHPMAGRERSGPLAARADLFEGRPWVLTPTPDTDTGTLNAVLELVALCGAMPIVMDAAAHDRAVALVSHAPQLLSSLVAARLEHADETAIRLSGQGVRDVTRIAASNPAMWVDILSANAGAVADVLAEFATDLGETVTALRALQAAEEAERQGGTAGIEAVMRRGNTGQARIPGKHGAPPTRYENVAVVLGDQPGELGRLFGEVGAAGVNIEDVVIEHSSGQQVGFVQLAVAPGAVRALTAALRSSGWSVRD